MNSLINNAASEAEQLEDKLNHTSRDLRNAEFEMRELQRKLADSARWSSVADADAMLQSKARLQQQIAALTQRKDDLTKAMQSAKSEIVALQRELSNYNTTLQHYTSQRANAEDKLRQAQAARDEAVAQHEQQIKRKQAITARLAALVGHVAES